jgi:hypothetical protein
MRMKTKLSVLFCLLLAAGAGAQYGGVKPPLGTPLEYSHLTVGLGAVWLFNEGAGKLANDASGNNRTATLGGDTAWAPGPWGACLQFDGNNDVVNITDASMPAFGLGDFTISAWVRMAQDATARAVIGKGATTGDGEFCFYKSNANAIIFYGDTGNINASITGGWLDNVWMHVAAVRRNGSLTIYRNGGQATGADATSNFDLHSTTNWTIGNSGTLSFDNNGQISDVGIWYRALSIDEIRTLYLDPYGMFPVDRPELYTSGAKSLYYYLMNQAALPAVLIVALVIGAFLTQRS